MAALLLIACSINVFKNFDTGGGKTTESTWVDPDPIELSLAWDGEYFHTRESNDQFYDVKFLGGGQFLISNPYFGNNTGTVYWVLKDFLTGEIETTAGAQWDGDYPNGLLGTSINVVSDGTLNYVAANEYGLTNEGRFFSFFSQSGTGNMSMFANIDITGATPGAFFGAASTTAGGNLYVSEGMTGAIYRAPVSILQTGSQSLSDFSLLPNVTLDQSATGYNAMDMDAGADGFAYVSFGGIVQHVGNSQIPDWYFDANTNQTGTWSVPAATLGNRNINITSFLTRLTNSYALTNFDSGAMGQSETIYLDPSTGAVQNVEAGVVSIVEGNANGKGWTAKGFYDYFHGDNTKQGYVKLYNYNGWEIGYMELPLPTPYNCVPMLATDGIDTLMVVCRYSDKGMAGHIIP